MRSVSTRRFIGLLSAAVLLFAALSALWGCGAVSYARSSGSLPAGAAFPAVPKAGRGARSFENVLASVFTKTGRSVSALGENELNGFFRLILREFQAQVSFDIGAEFDTSRPFAEEIASHSGLLLGLGAKYRDSASSALANAAVFASREFGVRSPVTELYGSLPSWQLAAALTWACGREEAARLMRASVSLELSLDGDKLVAAANTADLNDVVAEMQAPRRFTADFVYSYFLTVFDDDFNAVEYNMPRVSPRYLKTIGLPLDYMFYYDSWYGPRQYSTRMHLGMDIHARKGSNIYSCTDGTVSATGYDDTAGFYVVITDPFGYEYHYYHMVRLTELVHEGDSVKRGDLIGHVGRTGNSDGNHLHLSIITPHHVHLNPYAVMCTVRDISE